MNLPFHKPSIGRASSKMRARTRPIWLVLALVGLALSTCTTFAQWRTQTIRLTNGWNAIFLEVQPEPRECDLIFAAAPFTNAPVEEVWGWNRRFSSVQFIDNPNQLVPGRPDWLVYLPAAHALSQRANLFIIEGGKTYLIKMPTNSPPVTWSLRGRVVVRSIEWNTDAATLVGALIDPVSPPTFQTFFAGSVGHSNSVANQRIFRLNPNGSWASVNPATTTLSPGQAFWIRTDGVSYFQGPIRLTLEQVGRMDFGRVLVEQKIRVRNDSTTTRSVVVRPLPSESPASNSEPLLAGPVPLDYWINDVANGRIGWTNLPVQLSSPPLAPGSSWELRLAVRRRDMAAFTPPAGRTDVRYQSLLEIADSAGAQRHVIPVTAEGLQNYLAPAGAVAAAGISPQAGPPGSSSTYAGLWVGNVTITNVTLASQTNAPGQVAWPFNFRVILHINTNGQATFLQKVWQVWQPGTFKPDPMNPAVQIVDQPGQFVLLTDDSQVGSFSGATLRDGQSVPRRFSTAAFGFRDPIEMTGDGPGGSKTLGCGVMIAGMDTVNPFRHAFHPEHASEAFLLNRDIEMHFTTNNGPKILNAGEGDTQLGGIYHETITGLHKSPLVLQGMFALHLASRVGAISNDRLK